MARTPRFSNWQQAWDLSFGLIEDLRLIWRLLQDPHVPGAVKLVPIAAVAYVLSPLDLLPDFVLGFGQLDDLAIVLLGLKVFISLSPRRLVDQYLREIRGQSAAPAADADEAEYITAEYRVMDDDE